MVAKCFHRQRLARVRRPMEQDWWNLTLTVLHLANHTQEADCELVHLLLNAPLPPGPVPPSLGADMET